jgi:SRSO17 transposase
MPPWFIVKHTALIQKRIKTAIESNCTLIVGQARFGSGSQNNMERRNKVNYNMSFAVHIDFV